MQQKIKIRRIGRRGLWTRLGRPAGWLNVSKTRRRGRHRQHRRNWYAHGQEMLWPSMGLRPWLRWLSLSLVRQADNPHRVALGFGIGVWVSFIPLFGTHLVLSFLLCLLLRGNYLAAVAGTFVGNPWTYALMWMSGYEVGQRLLGTPRVNIHTLMEGQISLALVRENAETLMHLALWPATLGGWLVGLPVAAAFYGLVYWQVMGWRRRRLYRLQERVRERLERRAGHEAARVER